MSLLGLLHKQGNAPRAASPMCDQFVTQMMKPVVQRIPSLVRFSCNMNGHFDIPSELLNFHPHRLAPVKPGSLERGNKHGDDKATTTLPSLPGLYQAVMK